MKQITNPRLLNGALIVLTLCLFAACLAYRQQARQAEILRDQVASQKRAYEEVARSLAQWEAKYPQQAEEFRNARP